MVQAAEGLPVLRGCRTFLFDCDGVLWSSDCLLSGAKELIEYLIGTKRNVFLITNNSTKSAEQYVSKCQKLGLPVSATNIVCSAHIAADYLSRHGFKGPVYVLGEAGMGLELDKLGITHFGIGVSILRTTHLTGTPTSYICKGVPFIATNEDAQLPVTNERRIPQRGRQPSASAVLLLPGTPYTPLSICVCI
ncbi:unnamed protein product [Echinostoma caproni]|uniref:4-nitrophenylphosphatase n=1 Tax=Echinostoma caproni TaxID=27848 RepID=A0A183BD58_9TREM|nr:unnamed protein product [Echinostoma caproni]